MVDYCGEMVPAELCTIDREGGADDFSGCGACFNDPCQATACVGCVVNRIFQEYARLTGQIAQPDGAESGQAEGEEPDVDNFIVNYSDGTQRVIEKGFFCEITPGEEESTLSFIMAHCAGRDLETIVLGCIELAYKLGFLSDHAE